jgi:hypothetical protein
MTQLKSNLPVGAGQMFYKQLTDKDGNFLTIPPTGELSILAMDFENAAAKDMLNGKYKYAVGVAEGKATPTLKAGLFNWELKQLNELFYGADVIDGAKLVATQKLLIPNGYSTSAKISNQKTLHLGKWVSDSQVKINGIVATQITDVNAALSGLQYKVFGGRYYFAKADSGKNLEITWACLGGATVVSTLKVPSVNSAGQYMFNINAFNYNTSVKKAAATWTKDTYNPAGTTPAASHYQASASGVYVFYASDTGSITIAHTTDSKAVSSVIAALPAAAYRVIVDPPGSMTWVSTVAVTLLANAGTAMTGVAVGEELAFGETPTSGQYDDTVGGLYDFAAADVGDTVKINYITDYEYLTLVPPNSGTFLDLKSVKNSASQEMRRVELTSPISLGTNEYAVDSTNGILYFDSNNAGEGWSVSYLYQSSEGQSYVLENTVMGAGVELELTIVYQGVRKTDTISGIRAVAKGDKMQGKEGAHGTTEVEFTLLANEDGTLWTRSSSVSGV